MARRGERVQIVSVTHLCGHTRRYSARSTERALDQRADVPCLQCRIAAQEEADEVFCLEIPFALAGMTARGGAAIADRLSDDEMPF
ncbi:MAG: hypothetical protein M3P51_08960 [Chloroflexota bacterium]|nr:hypothetical protein [Chloroflexota bacterium]